MRLALGPGAGPGTRRTARGRRVRARYKAYGGGSPQSGSDSGQQSAPLGHDGVVAVHQHRGKRGQNLRCHQVLA